MGIKVRFIGPFSEIRSVQPSTSKSRFELSRAGYRALSEILDSSTSGTVFLKKETIRATTAACPLNDKRSLVGKSGISGRPG